MANLEAAYTSLNTTPRKRWEKASALGFPPHTHSFTHQAEAGVSASYPRRLSPPRHLPLLTLQSHHTADHDDVASSAFLHVGHHLLDHADHPEEVGLKHFLHVLDGDALHRAHQADACVVDCSGEGRNDASEPKTSRRSMMRTFLLTEDVHVAIFDAVDALFHRLVAADIQNSQRKGVSVHVPRSFQQLVLAFQVPHRGDDCETGFHGAKTMTLFQEQQCSKVVGMRSALSGLSSSPEVSGYLINGGAD